MNTYITEWGVYSCVQIFCTRTSYTTGTEWDANILRYIHSCHTGSGRWHHLGWHELLGGCERLLISIRSVLWGHDELKRLQEWMQVGKIATCLQ